MFVEAAVVHPTVWVLDRGRRNDHVVAASNATASPVQDAVGLVVVLTDVNFGAGRVQDVGEVVGCGGHFGDVPYLAVCYITRMC